MRATVHIPSYALREEEEKSISFPHRPMVGDLIEVPAGLVEVISVRHLIAYDAHGRQRPSKSSQAHWDYSHNYEVFTAWVGRPGTR